MSLRELAKTCNFCSDQCTQKNIRDQIIKGLLDGDTVEDLLKEKDLTLEKTITTCHAQEAAKRQQAEISHDTADPAIQTIRRSRPTSAPPPPQSLPVCPGCGGGFHQGGRKQCPAYNLTCHTCKRIGHLAKVCRARKSSIQAQSPPSTMAVQLTPHQDQPPPQINTAQVGESNTVEPAPTINIHISSLNSNANIKTLPDSGADISVAGKAALSTLGEHVDNLLPSQIIPRAVNGTRMYPIRKLPVTLALGGRKYVEDLHIYPNVKGVLLSWKAAKGLNILPKSYPHPSNHQATNSITTTATANHAVTSQQIMNEFSSVFDRQIKTMDGEKFHIALIGDTKPFCVKAPRAIPFAYGDKLKEELDLLQQQGIRAPVTEPTEWCVPIVVTPKKDTKDIRMYLDLSHLNKYIKRERCQSATHSQAVADIHANHAEVFTKLDAMKGYH